MSVKSHARCLILNGAGAGRGQSNLVALLEGGHVVEQIILSGRGASEKFAPSVQALLQKVSWTSPPERVVAVVGAGSFTGLRASLSLASGLVKGWGCQGIGVRLGDAVRETAHRKDLSVLCLARRGRIFVDSPARDIYAHQIVAGEEAPWSSVAGDAVFGEDALEDLVGKDGIITCSGGEIIPYSVPDAEGIFKASLVCTPLPLEPLYVDPPEAKLPSGGLRPAPLL